ncbi:hypothetical protein CERSUDRAFT_69049 [Gelatoporia subvermispora B]|uniref:Conserved oligomeric Golgi complex subunit 7 n=1 Tax=Ceriporiopsis subvermispora (strain B) TaxID=914234 RepID=M2R174_CERS8|nr:hypothetical protein CERSUDRAFT_69049 [Gelatoporia subvermispora B]
MSGTTTTSSMSPYFANTLRKCSPFKVHRTVPRTAKPCLRRVWMTQMATKPLAPVTRTLLPGFTEGIIWWMAEIRRIEVQNGCEDTEDTSLESCDSVVSWINEVLDADTTNALDDSGKPASLTELDKRITSLVGTLEIASEDTSSQVERLIDDISRGASRLTYDLHFMREGALTLQSVLHDVESTSRASLSTDTNAALERLHFLDTVKRNMEAAREVLREAESWGTLESDVTSLLGEKNYEKAAERLGEASKSMAVFEGTPEYESRRTMMVSLQNQLEAALSSALVAAVQSQDVAVCRSYFTIFSNIQRETEFRNYYYGSRRASLTEAWANAKLSDCSPASASSDGQSFATFLSAFYASCLTVLQNERVSIPSIFPDPQPTMSSLITTTLNALQPTFSERLSSFVSYHGAAALPPLIAVYRVTEEFAIAVQKLFEKLGYSPVFAPAAPSDSTPQRTLHRRRSSRSSMSMARRPVHRASISGSDAIALALPNSEWEQALFEPFVDFQTEYGALEQRFLESTLGVILASPTVRGNTGSDRARSLRERAVDVFSAAEDALGRCTSFTHGYGASGLVHAVDRFVASFVNTVRQDVTGDTKQAGPGTAGMPGAPGAAELSDLDYKAEDWAEIQALLHLLEAVRALSDRTATFENALRTALVQVAVSIRGIRASPGIPHLSGTPRGALMLLVQSTLNSVELQDLLGKVEPEAAPGTALDSRRSPHVPTPPASSPPPPLLPDARTSISLLARTCQTALQTTLLAPLRAHLASYPQLQLWSESDAAQEAKRSGGATSEVQVPTFSRSPSTPMQRVAEGLLNLPRLFEVYAADDALAVELASLPFVSRELLESFAAPPPPPDLLASASSSSSSGGMPHTRRSPSLSLRGPPVQPASLADADMQLAPEAVASVWLSALGRALLAHLTRDVLPRIRALGAGGAAQLAADLGYLGNVARALGVEWAPLEQWRRWVEAEDADGKTKLSEVGRGEGEGKAKEGSTEQEEGDDQVLRTVAKLRGWAS